MQHKVFHERCSVACVAAGGAVQWHGCDACTAVLRSQTRYHSKPVGVQVSMQQQVC